MILFNADKDPKEPLVCAKFDGICDAWERYNKYEAPTIGKGERSRCSYPSTRNNQLFCSIKSIDVPIKRWDEIRDKKGLFE